MSVKSLAWGARVSSEFRARAITIADLLGVQPDGLMSCIAWESGRTFSPSVRNAAGSGAVGLIQMMPATAHSLGTTTDALAQLSAVEQLDYVEQYFRPYLGRLRDLADLYMAILWPSAVGKPASYVLWTDATRPTTYRQNSGLDINRDGAITKAEAAAKVQALVAEGRQPENIWRS